MKSSNSNQKRRRTFVRFLGEINHALHEALEEEFRARGLTQAEMARIIGRSKSFVSRKMSGTSNMTIETLADLAFALDRPVMISFPSRHPSEGGNYTYGAPAYNGNLPGSVSLASVPRSMPALVGDKKVTVTAQ